MKGDKGLWMILVSTIMIVATINLSSLLIWSKIDDLGSQQAQLRRALSYECSTNKTLDKLVQQAISSTDLAIKTGTYEQFVKNGVLSQAQVDQIESSVSQYRDAHSDLQKNGACEELLGALP